MSDLPPIAFAAILAALLAALFIDYRQTFWNLANNNETNRAILYLFARLGPNGVAVWFGGAAVVALLVFAASLHFDKAGVIAILGVFWIGMETSYIRSNLQKQRGGNAG